MIHNPKSPSRSKTSPPNLFLPPVSSQRKDSIRLVWSWRINTYDLAFPLGEYKRNWDESSHVKLFGVGDTGLCDSVRFRLVSRAYSSCLTGSGYLLTDDSFIIGTREQRQMWLLNDRASVGGGEHLQVYFEEQKGFPERKRRSTPDCLSREHSKIISI